MKNQKGFTLLELSIVVMIISLIVGGIIISQSLTRSAQLKSIIEESQRYTQAVMDFRDKYQQLPGDFTTATTYWTTANGDGNGRITTQTAGTAYEQFRAWQHLAYAGMVEGSFTGAAGSLGSWDRVPETNVPASRLRGGGWGLINLTVADIGGGMTDISYANGDVPPNVVLWFGGRSITGLNNRQHPLLTTEEGKQLDQKIDDGYALIGKVVAQYSATAPVCINGINYDLTETRYACALVFKTGL